MIKLWISCMWLSGVGFALVASSVSAGVMYGGSATNGTMSCDGQFIYDTGNALSGTVISQTCAQSLGLGTLGADGKFTAPAGTADTSPNKGAYTLWCFPNVNIKVKDSNGKECEFTQQVYVAKDQGKNPGEPKGNGALAGVNILNQDWINAVKGKIEGAGAVAKATWMGPPEPPDAKSKSTETKIDSKTGLPQQTIKALMEGSVQGIFIYKPLEQYTFITETMAADLGLTINGSIDLLVADPLGLDALGWTGMGNTGQTVFQTAFLSDFDLDIGAPPQFGQVLILNDANSDFGIIGASFIRDSYDYSNGAGANGGDLLCSVPEPASFAIFCIGTVGAVVRAKMRRKKSI